MAYRNIAISGRIAVGSTSLAQALSQELNWPLRDGGQIFRQVMAEKGFNLETDVHQAVGDRADEFDREVDDKTVGLLSRPQGIIVTSKLAGFLSRDIKHTLHVLITCPLDTRIKRYSQDRGYQLEEAQNLIQLRQDQDQEKWSHLYSPCDFFDSEYFDLVLDSGELSVEEETKAVRAKLQ